MLSKRLQHTIAAMVAALVLATSGTSLVAAQDTQIVIDQQSDAATIDPHLQWDLASYAVYRNIFDNLLSRSKDGELIPWVASSWEYSSPTTLDMTIRDDIRFHDGTPLTVDDVIFSVERIIDPEFASPQLSQFNAITDAEAISDHVVRLTTATPYPTLLSQLAKLYIVPRAYVEKVGSEEFNLHPIGSGPYEFVSWDRGVKITLAANADHWNGKPYFETAVFNAVPDLGTRIADLRSGRAQLARGLGPDDALVLQSVPELKILSAGTEGMTHVFINEMIAPTSDLRVRQAMAHAIDRQLILDALLGGYGAITDIMLAPGSFGYVDGIGWYDYDPDTARKLIEEAGATGAKIIMSTSPNYDQRVTQAIQKMLQDIGLDPVISSTDQPTYLARRQGPAEDAGNISVTRWACACLDADGMIWPLFDSASQWSKYRNPEFDAIVEKARSTVDAAERLEYYRQAFTILHDDVATIPLYQTPVIYGARKELQWQPTVDDAVFIADMSWKTE